MGDLVLIRQKLIELDNLKCGGDGYEYFMVLDSFANSMNYHLKLNSSDLWFPYQHGWGATYAAFPDEFVKRIEKLKQM